MCLRCAKNSTCITIFKPSQWSLNLHCTNDATNTYEVIHSLKSTKLECGRFKAGSQSCPLLCTTKRTGKKSYLWVLLFWKPIDRLFFPSPESHAAPDVLPGGTGPRFSPSHLASFCNCWTKFSLSLFFLFPEFPFFIHVTFERINDSSNCTSYIGQSKTSWMFSFFTLGKKISF